MPPPIYVWTTTLNRSLAEYAHFRGFLSADERARADRFLRSEARLRFTVSRGLLRTLLAPLVGRNPESIELTYAHLGKPELVSESDVQFNVSHSAEQWYMAATFGRRIGVDVERLRPTFATLDIARRFFSTPEVDELTSVADGERIAAFFRCWTRKEAFIKAIGDGLTFPLDAFEVSLQAGAAELRSIHGSREDARLWSMAELPAPAGFAAALAVEGAIDDLHVERVE